MLWSLVLCRLFVLKLWPWSCGGDSHNWERVSRCGRLSGPLSQQLWVVLSSCGHNSWRLAWLTELCRSVGERQAWIAWWIVSSGTSINSQTSVGHHLSMGLEDISSSCSRAMTITAWHSEGSNSCPSSSGIVCGLQLLPWKENNMKESV